MRIVQRLQRRLEQIFAQAEHAERQQRRKRRRATAGESFFVRQLEARQVLSADVVAGQQLTVAENSAAGTVVGTVQTTPQIDPAQPLTFSITAGNSSNAFLIAPNSGEIQVNNAVALDFETTPEWQLTIGVQADGETSPESTGVVTIRLTDVHAPAVVQLTGGDATLSLVDGHLHVQQGSTTLFDAPLADVSSLTVFGSNDADTLIVDSTNGNPIPDGGLLYDGGSQPAGTVDAVQLRGTFDSVAYRYDNGNDGGITVAQGGIQRTIEYRNLEPVNDFSIAAAKSFTLSASADNVVLEEISPGTLRIRSTDAVPTFEATTFTAPTSSLTLKTGDGNDKITVRPLSGTFSVHIDGEAGTNSLIIDQTDAPAASPSFQFAGFTFDHTDTPNVATVLSNGPLTGGYGAVINVGPDAATGNVAFPESGTGFDSSLSVGRLIYPALTSGTLALNMPAGNVGTSLRAGIELSWTGGRTLSNQTGDDFVIYESSSNPGGPDAAMVQVHVAGGGWTKWRYEAKDTRELYVGSTAAGAFATSYDLSDFGLSLGQTIDAIRYVNMTGADRMEGTGIEKVSGSGVFVATGFVLPGDNGATSNVLPDPGSSASFAYFGNSTFDPDPLYFGMLHPLATPTTSGGIDSVRVDNATVTITRDGTLRPTISFASVLTLDVNTHAGVDDITVALGGASLPNTIHIDGGDPSVSDKVTIEGTTGNHTIALAGNTVTSGPTTISLANVEAAVIDVSAGPSGSGDTVTLNRSFTLSGTTPSLQILGGGSDQNDALSVNTEFDPVAVAPQTYSFAGVSFDQTGTPDQLSELGLGTLSGGQGVVVTTRPGDSSVLTSGFPSTTAGFNASLSIGALWERTTSTSTRVLGLPDSGNNGSTSRGGFVLSWSGDRVLVDAVGNDFVIYESGTTNSPEPMMVQVHDANTNTWSSWIYKPASSQAVTSGAPNVGFATTYDLSADFGLAGATIDAIRVVNLIASDRMQSASGIGVVLPGETNPTSTTLPLPGPQASFASYGTNDLDPDPIYFGVTHALGGVTARNDVVSIDPDSVDITGYMTIGYSGLGSLAVNTGDGADSIRVAPSTTTIYSIDGGSPSIATNPGDRVVLDFTAGVGSPLLTVTGIGSAVLTSTYKTVIFAGIDSFGATAPFDVKASAAANPAAEPDTFSVVRNGGSDEVTVNGQLVFRADRSAIDNLLIDGSTDDDTLTVNFAGGDPIPAGNINFAASTGSNTLVYNGSGITTITHRFDNTTDGRTTIDGSIVDYTGVAQVLDNLTAANRNLVFTAVDNDIVLANDTSTAGRSQATSNNSPVLKFSNPTSTLTVDAGPNNDSVTLEQLDAAFAAATTLRGQTGDDFILLDSNGPGTAGGTVDWITFAVTVDGGQTGDRLTIEDSSSTRNKTYSVSNVQIGGGIIPAGAAVDTPDPSPTVDGTVGAGEWNQVPTAFDTGARPAADLQSILHFNFSEGSGTATADTTGNGNNGLLVTPIGPQFRSTSGVFGGALEFNGTTDYAWSQDSSFDVGTKGSLSFWVNMDDVSRRNEFFEGPGNLGLEFQYRENGSGATKGQFYGTPNHAIVGDTDDFAIQRGGAAALAGTWVNLQYSWQKLTATTGEMHLYVNGSEVTYLAGSDSNITNWTKVANTAQAFMTMGRDASTTPGATNSRYFDGKMDDVAWFDVVLTSGQRNAIYLAGPTPVIHSIDQIQATVGHDQVFDAKSTNPANGHLVAYWNMDNAPGTSLATGNGGTTVALHTTAEGTEAQFLPTGGKFGGALDFTNPESYATFQDPTFDVAAEGSVSLWLFMRDGLRRNELFEGPGDSGFEFQFRDTTNGQFYGYVDRATGNTDDPAIQSGNARNNVGAWHNLIYTWKRTSATAGELRIYIDGSEVTYLAANNQSITGWNNLVSTVNGLMKMGGDQGAATPDRWLDAKVDDVAWFNQVLSSAQRAALQAGSVDSIQATIGHDPFFDAKAVNAANGHLLAYWNFDNPVGTTVVAGNGGTPITLNLNVPAAAEGVAFDTVAGPTLPGTGTQIKAAAFDGNFDFIRVTDSTSLDFNKQQGTISFWVNPTTHAVDNTSAGFSNLVEDSNEQINVGISWQQDAGAAMGNADFYRRIVFSPFENTSSSNQNLIVSNTRLTFGQWTHVTVTWDFATHSAAIYINGVLDSTIVNKTSNPAIWTQAANNTGDWIFGADGKAASGFFTGEMADIAVFGSALNAGAVQSTYQNGAGNSGGFDLAGVKARFTWDATMLYGLIEDYPAGAANSNGPFSNVLVDLYYNGTLVTSLDASQPGNNVPGSVVASGGGGARYEFSIPFASISPTFNPANGDSLTYKVRTIDADVPGAGFDSRDTTLGWVTEPPLAADGYRQLDFAKSENFFGVGGRLTYGNVADFTLNAGNGVDTISVVDSKLAVPVTNPTKTFTINAGGGNDDVTIASIDSAFRAAITIDAGAGADDHVAIDAPLTLGSALSTGNLLVTAERIDVTAPIDTTAGTVGDVTFHAATKLTMSAAADVAAGGDFLADGGAIDTAADITTFGGSITFVAPTMLTGDVVLTSHDGNIRFSGATTTVDGDWLLTIDAGAGDVNFDAAVGSSTPLSGLVVTAKILTVASTLKADDQGIDVDTTDTAKFSGAVTTTNHGTMTVTNGGVLTIEDAANLLLDGAFLQDGVGRTDLFANITTTNDAVTFNGPLQLKDDVTFTTAGGAVHFNSTTATIDGDYQLTVAANGGSVKFEGKIGNNNRVSGIKITSSQNITFNETAKLDDQGLDLTSAGAMTFNNAVDTKTGGAVKLANTGVLTIADAANLSLDGAFKQDGAGRTDLFADITTTGDKVTFQGPLNLKDDVTLTTAGGDVLFDTAATVNGGFLLSIDAGAGNVTFDGVVGGLTRVDGIKIVSAGNVAFNRAVSLDDRGLDLKAAGTVAFSAAVDTTNSGNVKIDNGALLTIADAADFSLDGPFQQVSNNATSLAGDITTTNDIVSFKGAVQLAPNAAAKVVIQTGSTGADITFQATLDGTTAGAQGLQLKAGVGNIQFATAVGATALGDVVIDVANNVKIDAAFTAKSLTHLHGTGLTTFSGLTTLNTASGTALDLETPTVVVHAEVKSIGGDLNVATDDLTIGLTAIPGIGSFNATSTGIVTIVTHTTARAIDLGLGTTPGRLGLSSAEVDRITAGTLRIGDGDSGAIDLSAAVAPAHAPILHLTSSGDVSGTGTIQVARLAVDALGDIKLANSNDVDRLGLQTLGAGKQISFRDVDDVLLADVDGIGGIETVDGNVTLETGGAVTQDVFGSIVAPGLQLLGAGPVDLSNPTNIVHVLAASLGDTLTFRNFDPFKVGTVQTFGPTTTGVTTSDDDVQLQSKGKLTLESAVNVGTAHVKLISDDDAIDDAGGSTPKVVAVELALSVFQGIGVTQPLEIDVDLLSAENLGSGRIAIAERQGLPLTIGSTGGIDGILNLGTGGTSITHVGPMVVDKPIVDAAGGVSLTTTGDGGNDDHLSLNAPILVLGGSGNVVLTAGTDLLLHDTGVLDDVQVVGSGEIFGTAGRNLVIDPGVRVTSGTGSLVAVPPLLENLTGPQIANTGAASVTFNYGRFLEFNFTALVNWGDGVSDLISLNTIFGATTAGHVYTGNPNVVDPAAPIPVSVTLRSDGRIHFTGYETTTQQVLLEFPGDGVKNVRIDTTPKVPHLSFPAVVRLVELPTINTTTLIRATVDEGGDSAVETIESADRVVILREVLPDGREGSSVRFGQSALDELSKIFSKLRDGRYRLYLFEPETQTLRKVMEIYVREGKPTSADAPSAATNDPADGAQQLPPTGAELPAAAALDSVNENALGEAAPAATAAALTTAAGLALVGTTTDWSARVDAALARYRGRSRLKARPTRRRVPPR